MKAMTIRDISPFAIATLADFYGVSADYLMGLTDNKEVPNADVQFAPFER